MQYLARRADSNRTIQCSIKQDTTNETAMSKTIEIKLHVMDKIAPKEYTWANQTNGLIIGKLIIIFNNDLANSMHFQAFPLS